MKRKHRKREREREREGEESREGFKGNKADKAIKDK